jgi:hypothetical protein
MALINTTTTGVLGSTFYGDGSGDLTIQQNGVLVNKITSNGLTYRGAGSVLQVVQSIVTSSASNGSNNNVTATGLSVTITPTNTTSRIMVFCNFGWSCTTVDFCYYAYRVNSTLDTTSPIIVFNQSGSNATNSLYFASLNKIYSPGSISAQTYDLVFYNGNAPTQASYFNARSIGGANGMCTMTAMEIAA